MLSFDLHYPALPHGMWRMKTLITFSFIKTSLTTLSALHHAKRLRRLKTSYFGGTGMWSQILWWALSHRWIGEFLVIAMRLHTSLSRLETSQSHLQGHNELIGIKNCSKVFTVSFCTRHIPLWSGLCCITYCPSCNSSCQSSCSYLFHTFCSCTSLKWEGKDYIGLL